MKYIIIAFLIYIVLVLISTNIIKKYISKRVEEDLKLLEEITNIENEIDGVIDRVKIKLYDVYLGKCRESLRERQKINTELREQLLLVKGKLKIK